MSRMGAVTSSDSSPWYRQFWPWFLIALPAISVVFSFATLVVAIRNGDSLVRDDYYEAGRMINRDFARERVARAKQVRATLEIDATSHLVRLALSGSELGDPASLVLQLEHPTHAERDRTVVLARTASGDFAGQLDLVPRGDWHLTLSPPDGTWRLVERVDLSRPGMRFLQAG
jgi:hypothetical protein